MLELKLEIQAQTMSDTTWRMTPSPYPVYAGSKQFYCIKIWIKILALYLKKKNK